MDHFDLLKRYQQGLANKDVHALDALFVDGGRVAAPLTGVVDAPRFHRTLVSRSEQAIVRLVNVFSGLSSMSSLALQFSYTWVRKDGKLVVIEGVGIFDVDPVQKKFTRLTILYDPTELQRYIDAEQAGSR